MSGGARAVAGGACSLVFFVLVCACEAVPSLTFEGDDGGAESGQCPDKAPQNATCCGTVPCYGPYCSMANCATCMNCSAGESCCAKNANMPMCIGAKLICH